MVPYPSIELAKYEANRYFQVLAGMWGPENMKEIINELQQKATNYKSVSIRKIDDLRACMPPMPTRMAKSGPRSMPLPPMRK